MIARIIKIQRIDNWTLNAGKIKGAAIPNIKIAPYKIIFLFIILDILFFLKF